MNSKNNNSKMHAKEDLIDSLYERDFLSDDEEIILSDGFEDALIGVSAGDQKIAIYDFWKALDCIMKHEENVDFDDALEWLEDFSKHKIPNAENITPIFVKTL